MEEQMVHQWQEDGWPLGLQPLNVRVGLNRRRRLDFSSSFSFSTLITASSRPSSASESSDSATESTGSLFRDRGITLGSLIGINSIFNLSRRSFQRSRTQDNTSKCKKNHSHKSKNWFSLCTKPSHDSESCSAPSLGHFLEVERRATDVHRKKTQQPALEPNSVASDAEGDDEALILEKGKTWVSSELGGRGSNGDMSNESDFGFPLLFSCIGGQCKHQ